MTRAELRKRHDNIVRKWWEEAIKRAYEVVTYRLVVGSKALDSQQLREYIEGVSK